jgi:hypothetical protein
MTQDEIQYIEWTMHDLRATIAEARQWCSKHFPRNAEVMGRINDLRCCYNRLEETLTDEIYGGKFKYKDDDPTELLNKEAKQ